MKPFVQKVSKPWGYELLLSPPESPVTSKILHLVSGTRFSLHFHEIKEETLTLINGQAKIIFGENENCLIEEEMLPNQGYFIPKGLIHRVTAASECDILESSTPEKGMTVRLQDDYQRKNETEEEREKARLL